MIRLSNNDAALLAMLAQYETAPLQVKRELIGDLSKKAKPIGSVLIGQAKRTRRKDIKEAAERIQKWAQRNRESRPIAHYKRVSNRALTKSS
jgi:hypothetical protein